MSASWIAGSVRARLLVAERRLGRDGAAEVAAARSLPEAVAVLASSPYRRALRPGLDLAAAQRAVAETTLLQLRLLAGWLPADALGSLRALAAWYELANLEDRVAYLAGGPLRHPFELGSLSTAWPRAAEGQSLEELRRILAASAWGDPGGATPSQLGLGLRLAWARRVDAEAPEAGRWAAGAAALLLVRALFVEGLPVDLLPVQAPPLLGSAWRAAGTFERFAESLPQAAAWSLAGVESPEDLWRAEAAWWTRVEAEAEGLLHVSVAGRGVVVAAAALLAADARRTIVALGAAARRGLPGVEEVLDAAA